MALKIPRHLRPKGEKSVLWKHRDEILELRARGYSYEAIREIVQESYDVKVSWFCIRDFTERQRKSKTTIKIVSTEKKEVAQEKVQEKVQQQEQKVEVEEEESSYLEALYNRIGLDNPVAEALAQSNEYHQKKNKNKETQNG